MMTEMTDTNSPPLFRLPAEKGGDGFGTSIEDEVKEKVSSDDEDFILCRQCLQVITHPSERTEVQGSHEHTFANPAGILFQIGCFRSAVGCTQVSPPTDEFSWFRGFSWRITVCSTCLTHLGWLFVSPGGRSFHGLILNRLVGSGK